MFKFLRFLSRKETTKRANLLKLLETNHTDLHTYIYEDPKYLNVCETGQSLLKESYEIQGQLIDMLRRLK